MIGSKVVVDSQDLQQLFDFLKENDYTIVGPKLRDGAIVYDNLASTTELPIGCTDEQNGGTYRARKRDTAMFFDYTVGPQSWKSHFLPPSISLWKATRSGKHSKISEEHQKVLKLALIGVRSCELHAIKMQDEILLNGKYVDPIYSERREGIFIVAVNCLRGGGTCFCTSTRTGPRVTFGFDLSLTEILDGERHYFVVDVGTEKGGEAIKSTCYREASEAELEMAERVLATSANHMGRFLNTTEIKELLYRNYDHPRWDDVANRCLTCGNCTLVCPTCFCTTVEDFTDLTGQRAERRRRWDSCFTMDFSYIHGGSVRATPKSRYRQWIIHKLASWIDQFGTLGCVGCGRCITWCPVAIDITEEIRAIRENEPDAPAIPTEVKYDVNA